MNGAFFFVSCYHIILFVTWLIVAVLRITAQYFGHYVLHPCAHKINYVAHGFVCITLYHTHIVIYRPIGLDRLTDAVFYYFCTYAYLKSKLGKSFTSRVKRKISLRNKCFCGQQLQAFVQVATFVLI